MNNYVHESVSATLQIRDASLSNGYVTIAIRQDGTSSMLLPPSERQTAAQALAGDDWRVVSAVDYAGLGSELHQARSEVEKLREHRDALKRQVTDLYGTLGAQPDRPEPVDPAAVELVLGVLQNVPRAPADVSLVDQARELVRRNVRVVNTDA